MLEQIKMSLVAIGALLIIISIIFTRLALLMYLGVLLIGIWALLTIFTWKANELSENLIALFIVVIGGAFGWLFWGEKIIETLGL